MPGDARTYLSSIPDLTFEACAFSCALLQTYRHIKEIQKDDGTIGGNSSTKSFGQQLVEIMFQDSLLYFIW